MIRILVKAFILVCIILSIYFIVNPSACSNLINGRVVNTTRESFKQQDTSSQKSELQGPAGDKIDEESEENSAAQENANNENTNTENAATDENSSNTLSGYSQEEVDYAIASRYVELEREYAKKDMEGKDMAKEISYTVMDDFELTPKEWEDFLQRATASNLFEKVREEYAQEDAQGATQEVPQE